MGAGGVVSAGIVVGNPDTLTVPGMLGTPVPFDTFPVPDILPEPDTVLVILLMSDTVFVILPIPVIFPVILPKPDTPPTPVTLPKPDTLSDIGEALPDRTPTEPPADTSCFFPYCLPASTTETTIYTSTLKTRKKRSLGYRVVY